MNELFFTGEGPGDIDADGLDDYLTIWFTTPGTSHVRARRGSDLALLFDWASPTPTPWGGYFNWFASRVGDLDGDGHADVALLRAAETELDLRSGASGALMATLTPAMFGWGNGAGGGIVGLRLAPAGDLDGNGGSEFLISGGPSNTFTGVAVVTWTPPGILYNYPIQPIVDFGYGLGGIGDVTGDGTPDYLIGSPRFTPALEAGRLEVYSGADGTLASTIYGTGVFQVLGGSFAAVSDIDGDGYPEIASMESQASLVFRSGVTLTPISTLPFVGNLGVVRLPDADGDGLDEVIVSNTGVIRVVSTGTGAILFDLAPLPGYYMQGIATAFGDVNGDGLGDFGVQFVPFPTTSLPPGIAQDLTWGWIWPPIGQGTWVATVGESWVYVARSLRVVGPTLVGGSASFDLLVPKHPGKAFQLAFSLEGQIPGVPVGPFLLPLVPDALFDASLAAGIGGTLDATGRATLSIPIPPNPALRGLEVKASGWVIDPAAMPVPIACTLTGEAFTLQ